MDANFSKTHLPDKVRKFTEPKQSLKAVHGGRMEQEGTSSGCEFELMRYEAKKAGRTGRLSPRSPVSFDSQLPAANAPRDTRMRAVTWPQRAAPRHSACRRSSSPLSWTKFVTSRDNNRSFKISEEVAIYLMPAKATHFRQNGNTTAVLGH